MADNKAPKKSGTSSFTVDHDSTGVVDMPSVTKLLNRKSLELSGSSKPDSKAGPNSPPPIPPTEFSQAAPPPLVPPPASEPTAIVLDVPSAAPSSTAAPPSSSGGQPGEITLSISDSDVPLQLESSGGAPASPHSASATSPATAKVQAAKPRPERRTATRLVLWDVKQLKNGPDPLGRGLSSLIDKGVQASLFLAITSAPAGSPVPHFNASAAIAGSDRLRVWTGLKWDPTVVPELWNLFVRTGHVELSPPGTQTNIKSNRNVVRAAFGVNQSEWLLLVRAGPASHCRGVLALITQRSLLTELQAAIPLITAEMPASTSKAS